MLNSKNSLHGKISHILLIIFCNGLGQSAFLLASPLISRLYTPQDFSSYAIYSAFFSILSTVILLRYELIIPTLKTHKMAAYLVLTCGIILLLSVGIIIILLLLAHWFLPIWHLTVPHYLYYLPLGLALYGIYRTVTYWMIRLQQYTLIAYTKLLQGCIQVFIILLVGYCIQSPIGLILGVIVGYSAAVLSYSIRLIKKDRYFFKLPYLGLVTALFLKLNNCYKYSTPAALLNTLNTALPTLIVITIFGTALGGQYSFAWILIATPFSVISQVLSQWYYGNACARFRQNPQKILAYYLKAIALLFSATLLPIILLGLFIPDIFTLLFQKEWAPAASLSKLLLLQAWFSFCVSSVSQHYNLLQKQYLNLLWNILQLLLLSNIGLLEYHFKLPLYNFVALIVFTQITAYILMFLFNIYCIKNFNLNCFEPKAKPCAYS